MTQVIDDGETLLSADAPITSAAEERLGRTPFAHRIADGILKWSHPSSIAVGIYGGWGSGKSSLLNLMVERLEARSAGIPEQERPIVIRFNPWDYSQQDQLVAAFFNTLSARLSRKDVGRSARHVSRWIQAYSAVLAPVQFGASLVHPGLGEVVKGARKVAEQGSQALQRMADLVESDTQTIKSEINELLSAERRQVVVVIDDIDRLSTDEIRQVFQLVKRNANFAHVVYLLAFDPAVVGDALEPVYGPSFVEKIIQVPVSVPYPDRDQVLEILYEELDKLLERTGCEHSRSEFLDLLTRGPSDWIANLRDVRRFVNALNFTLPLASDQVFVPEFVAVEAVRLFRPSSYVAIQRSRSYLLGEAGTKDMPPEESTAWFRRFREDCGEEWGSVEELIERLFPVLRRHTRNWMWSGAYLENWASERRIVSKDAFDTYFSFGLSARQLSDVEFQRTLEDMNNASALREHVRRMAAAKSLRAWLLRLSEYAGRLKEPAKAASALLSVGGLTPTDDGGFVAPSSNGVLAFAIWRALETMDWHERHTFLAALLANGTKAQPDILTLAQVIAQEETSSHDHPPEHAESLTRLQGLLVQHISRMAEDGSLLDEPHLPSLVRTWLSLGSGNEPAVSVFLRKALADERMMPRVLEVFVITRVVSQEDNLFPRREFRADRSILRLVDFEDLLNDLRYLSYDEGPLSDREREMMSFLRNLDPAELEKEEEES